MEKAEDIFMAVMIINTTIFIGMMTVALLTLPEREEESIIEINERLKNTQKEVKVLKIRIDNLSGDTLQDVSAEKQKEITKNVIAENNK